MNVVEIIINDKNFRGEYNKFDKSYKDGQRYVSVDFSASSYGMGSPCSTSKEIADTIEEAKKWITREGDKWKIVDKRESSNLSRFFK